MSEREMSLSTTASRPLLSSLPRAWAAAFAVLGREADQDLPGAARRRERSQHVGRGLQRQRQLVAACLLDLGVLRLHRAEVRDRGGHQQHVGVGELGLGGGVQLRGGLHDHHPHARRRLQGHVGGDQRDLGAAAGGLRGQRHAHPPGRAVAHVAHRVDRLARAARRDQDPQAVERARAEGRRCHARGQARSTSASTSAGSASRPAPHSPFEASRPVPGATIGAPRRRSVSTFACVAGCSHMWLFMAGASTSGAVEASAALVSRLSARPAASLAIVLADAGATKRRRRGHQLEVRDRVVVGRGVAREGAAGGVGLELVDQHRRAGDALEGGLAHEPSGSTASAPPAPSAPAVVARRTSSTAL